MNTTHAASVAHAFSASVADNKNNPQVNEHSPIKDTRFKEDMQKASDNRSSENRPSDSDQSERVKHEKKHHVKDGGTENEKKSTTVSSSVNASDTNEPASVVTHEDEAQATTALNAYSPSLNDTENTALTPLSLSTDVATAASIATSGLATNGLVTNGKDISVETELHLAGFTDTDGDLAINAESQTLAVNAKNESVVPMLPNVNTVTSTLSATRKDSAVTASVMPLADPLSLLPVSSAVLAVNKGMLNENSFSQQLVDAFGTEDHETAISPLIPRAKMSGGEPLLPHAHLANTPAPLNTSFTSPRWGEAVTEKVMWMSSRGLKEATIQLDPPELGQMKIKIGIHQDQAQVSFTVQNSSVREALDSHALRLRDMFAEEGLNLADVDVSDQSQSHTEEQDQEGVVSLQGDSHDDSNSEAADSQVQVTHGSYSLIDSYV